MTALWFVLSNWKLILGGLTVAILGAYIGYLNLVNAHLETKLARIEADFKTCQTVNASNVTELEQIRLDTGRAIAAVTADRDRIVAEKPKVRIVKQVIHEKAQECVGVPPADRAAGQWLWDNRDDYQDRAGKAGNPAGPPKLPAGTIAPGRSQ